jgi:hypothetical protein
MPVRITTESQLAAAKAQLIKLAAEIDPLAPMRKHPYITIAVAATAGVVLGSTADTLVGAAVLGRTANTVLHSITKVMDGFKAARAEKSAQPAKGEAAGASAGGK